MYLIKHWIFSWYILINLSTALRSFFYLLEFCALFAMKIKMVLFFISFDSISDQLLQLAIALLLPQQNILVGDHHDHQKDIHKSDAIEQPVVGEPAHHFTNHHAHTPVSDRRPDQEGRAFMDGKFVSKLLGDGQKKREQHRVAQSV